MATQIGYDCQASAYRGRFGFGRCCRRGVIYANGKYYCKQHDPNAVAKRREEREKRFQQEEKRGDDLQRQAKKLLKQLGIKGEIEFSFLAKTYTDAIVISFDEAQKLIDRLKS